MPINQKIDIFIQFVRNTKKGFFKPLVIASIVSVIIIAGVSIFLLVHTYSNIANNYYKNILYDIYDFQNRVISRERYRDDIASLSKKIVKRIGIKEVWVVDRNGKCVFHSNKNMMELYLGKNLPIDYFKNINVIWKFEKGYPEIVKTKVRKIGLYRLSIPLYPFGKDYYDFILGIDASFIPINLPFSLSWPYILILVFGVIIISGGILFFPIWFITNRKFNEISTQAMILGGALKTEQKEKEEKHEEAFIEPEEKVEEEVIPETKIKEETAEKPRKEKKTGLKKEKIKVEEAHIEENPIEESQIEESHIKETSEEGVDQKEIVKIASVEKDREPFGNERKIKEKLEKMEAENPNIRLLELKQSVFRKKKNEFSNLIVESFPYHSGSVLGNYVTILEKESIIWPLIFSYYNSDDVSEGYEIIKELYGFIDDLLNNKNNIKMICSSLNKMCIEKKLKSDFTIIKIDKGKVEYTALGNNYALYLKGKDSDVKELSLDLPKLGEVEDDLEDHIRIADIEFEKNDIFLAMPSNAKMINVNSETMDILIKKYLVEYRSDYQNMGNELNKVLKSYFKKNRKIEETGFIGIKFL